MDCREINRRYQLEEIGRYMSDACRYFRMIRNKNYLQPETVAEAREKLAYCNRTIQGLMESIKIPDSGPIADLSNEYFSLVSRGLLTGDIMLSDIAGAMYDV